MTANRRLCPFCNGNNDSCPSCDGGWITDDDPSEVTLEPVPMIVDLQDRVADKGSSGFRPNTRKISLGPQPETTGFALQALTIAAKAIAVIEKDRERSNRAYFNAADSAFKIIKELIAQNKNEAMKPRLKKLLDTAYYHRKKAQSLEEPRVARNEAATRTMLSISEAGGRKQKLKPNPSAVPTKSPTLMEIKLAEVIMKQSKR